MAEAQPSKKRGGHAYGRRTTQLSNTAEQGELCLYTGHSLGRFSTHSMRYDSHQACVRCVASAREGRMSFDISRLLKKYRKRALKFWSQVDIGAPDEAGIGKAASNVHNNQFSWSGGQEVRRSIILSGLLCGSLGATLVIPGSKLLAAISIAVILFILFHKTLESCRPRQLSRKF